MKNLTAVVNFFDSGAFFYIWDIDFFICVW